MKVVYIVIETVFCKRQINDVDTVSFFGGTQNSGVPIDKVLGS
jgi:hypothetical protein